MNKQRMTLLGAGIATGALFSLAAGCGGGASTAGAAGSGTRSATVPLYLTDAPLSGADAVTVTIDRIEAHAAGGAFFDTGVAPVASVNLLTLKDAETLIGSAQLAPGQYTGLRLYLSNPTITIAGTTYPLIPVGGQGQRGKAGHATSATPSKDGKSATILIAAPFTVAADGSVTPLLLDFNVAHSVVATGNGRYLLKPVIKLVRHDQAGGVNGHVALDPAPAGEAPEVSVSVTPHGESGPDAEENGGDADDASDGGGFRVHALPAGTYDVTVTAAGYAPVTIPNVVITPGQRPDLGTITLRKP
jgi:hypothetical protein